ncbi:uncharacterized protein FIBRA_04879 [Fibroporia radiculosa]|uniref:Uncharacterized protein n=1 Tax=Fibroporia radiculosa TaxID=599839 RepID=J4IAE5_9APHY|nr:uncharacterized protein FIBRA_04879 [Fibroporia radiculosa]CCM02771.1 predicted protein [Fibroporia radiculosa]
MSSVLIRAEYPKVLQHIISRAVIGTTKNTRNEDDEAMEVDAMELSPFYNPFVDLPLQLPVDLGAVVIGNPGVGKSMFLLYVLVLRLLVGLPTILQLWPGELLLFVDEGVFTIPFPLAGSASELQRYIPRFTWIFVDSSPKLTGVHQSNYSRPDLSSFILQAASPCWERIQWMKKQPGSVQMCWMDVWPLEELIIGYAILYFCPKYNIQCIDTRDTYVWPQPSTRPSESQLLLWFERYGANARPAYGFGAAPDDYDDMIVGPLRRLDKTALVKLLHEAIGANMEANVSHLLITAAPAQSDRRRCNVRVANNYLLFQILERLEHSLEHVASELYDIFSREQSTRAAAGVLLEGAFLITFPQGGGWPITAMQKSEKSGLKNTHWHSSKNTSSKYLCLGFKAGAMDIATTLPSGRFDPLDRYHCSTTERLTLRDGFYVSESKSQPTFDAFIYDDRTQHAIMFQVTVALNHGISEVGLD